MPMFQQAPSKAKSADPATAPGTVTGKEDGPVMSQCHVSIGADGTATIDGRAATVAGESVQTAVLDHLYQRAVALTRAVEASVLDHQQRISFRILVRPDGASQFLDTPVRLDEYGSSPQVVPAPAPSPPAVPVPLHPTAGADVPSPEPTPLEEDYSEPQTTILKIPAASSRRHTPAPVPETPPLPSTPPPTAPETPPLPSTPPPTVVRAPTAPSDPDVPVRAVPDLPRIPESSAPRTAQSVAVTAGAGEQRPAPPPQTARTKSAQVAVPAELAAGAALVWEAVTAGDLVLARVRAAALVQQATHEFGSGHLYTLESRALEAYVAYLSGEHGKATALSLQVAELRHQQGDPRAREDIERAHATWELLNSPYTAVPLGRKLLALWDLIAAAAGTQGYIAAEKRLSAFSRMSAPSFAAPLQSDGPHP
ncbi:hypothetical protein ABZ608_41200 [Streptomyces sp. NPDC013172]|uniref:hypothetical protein n=1 Tax=Streptomyces sp. NPDC013172 TaxID=3155009 RepID=UPI0033F11045